MRPIVETSDVSEAERQSWIVQQEIQKEQVEQQKRQESEAFYTSLGHPELAGKYEPFPISSGEKIQKIEETPSGLEVTFTQPQEQKGIAETLASYTTKPVIDIPRLFGVPRTPQEALVPPSMRKETVRPLAGIAGVIAPTESLVYTVGRLAGLETPRLPPTLISLAPSKAMEYGPEYAAGTISGDILLSIGFGKVAGKVWEVIPSKITSPIEKVGEAIAKPFRPITEPIMSKLEKIALWPYEKIAPGIVSIPTPERVGLEGMEAQFTAWELAEAPKTSGYLISKMPAEPLAKAWATEHLFKTVTGGLSYALVREQLRATAPPTMPYLPETELVGFTAKGLALGVGVTLLPKALQQEFAMPKLETVPRLKPAIKLKQPTFEEPYPIQKLKLFPQAYPRQKEKQRQIPSLAIFTPTKQTIKQILVPGLVIPTPTKQIQIQIPSLLIPTPPPPLKIPTPTIPPAFRLPRGGEDWSRLAKGLFGKWFKREHAIPTERQIMRQLGFGTRKRKGVKRRRR